MVIAEVVNALLHGGDPTRMAGTVMVGPISLYLLLGLWVLFGTQSARIDLCTVLLQALDVRALFARRSLLQYHDARTKRPVNA